MEYIEYKDFYCEHTNEKICNWMYREIDTYTRIVFKLLPNGGFYFYIIRVAMHIDEVFSETSEVECIFMGTAYYDVIRHLYMGNVQTDNFGYLYYPNISFLIKCMEILRELEEEYCKGE